MEQGVALWYLELVLAGRLAGLLGLVLGLVLAGLAGLIRRSLLRVLNFTLSGLA